MSLARIIPTRFICTIAMLAASLSATAAEPAPPDVNVVVAKLDLAAGTVSNVRNISPGKGSNFQPSFVGDGSAVLFVSQRSGTANIYRYVMASGETQAVTSTKESLYSPQALADGSGFTAVRVVTADPAYGLEATEPPVWRFSWDGKPVAPLVDTRRVGYYAPIGDKELAMFIVDTVPDRNAHKAVLLNRATGKMTVLTTKPGRSFGKTPDGKRVAFVDQTDPKRWVISAMGAGDKKPQVLVDTVVGKAGEPESARSQYFAWLPDGSMMMANGNRLFRWDGVKGGAFKQFAELPGLGGSIKNIAFSKDGTQLAFSVVMDAVPQ